VLGLLFVVYVFNFIDRQVLSILLEQVKRDLAVSDTFMGLLTGFAFAFLYTFAGIPIARYADRASRKSVIAVGLVVWSSMTAVSGLARSGLHLALARVGVGVGEAAGTPPAHSLLSDYFPPEQRATALSIYAMGVYVGVAFAFIGGGWLGEQFGWRTVFYVVGLAGLPLAVLVWTTVRELPRGFSDRVAVAPAAQIPFGAAARQLARNRSFVLIVLATSLQSLSGYGIMTWGPTFLIRQHGMPVADVGLTLGLAIGLMGGLGVLLGGRLADRFGARDARWYMRLPALETAALIPFVLVFILADDLALSLAAFYPFYLLGAMYVGPMHSTIQGLVVPGLRATASALNLFVVNMIGLGVGPLLIGALNDLLADRFGQGAIRYSMLSVALIGGVSSWLFWLSSRDLREDLQAARDAASGATRGADRG
jgi:predicted MFS family arabinose efflux permease